MIVDALSAGVGAVCLRENEGVAMPKAVPRCQSK